MPDSQAGGGNELTEGQLRWGTWFVRHRAQLEHLELIALGVVGVATWTFVLWGLVNHFFIDGPRVTQELHVLASRANAVAVTLARQRPTQLQIAEVRLLALGGGAYDVAARVVNPNSRWTASGEYVLTVPGAPDEVVQTAFLPGSERWLARLNVSPTGTPSGATLTFRSISWQRVPPIAIPDSGRYLHERLHVQIQDAKFTSASTLALQQPGVPSPASTGSAPASVSRATFSVVNASAYGLRNLELVVLLSRAGGLIGVSRTTLVTLDAGERRAVAETWFRPVGLVDAVTVIPYVNVFDPASFIERR